jgi:D-amino peptidase
MGSDPDGYEKARKNLMLDVNAAICGAFDGGADEVSVFDGHGTGANFIKEELDSRVYQLTIDEYFRTPVEQFDFDGLFSIGAHAMAGTANAFLDHTQSSVSWFDFKINGKSHGEIGQQAALFGVVDIPLLMVSGDRAACIEAEKLIPGVVTACTKEAMERNCADCLPIDKSTHLIYKAARASIQSFGKAKPYKVSSPITFDVTFTRNDYCDEAIKRDPSLIRNGRRVTRILDRMSCALDTDWF